MFAPLAFAPLLAPEVELPLAGIAVDAMRHQRMCGVERALDMGLAVALLALGDIALGEVEIFENALGVGPLFEEVVVLEKMIMAEGGVGDDERLHRRRILLHEVGDAGRGIDDDLISEAAQALAVERFVLAEMFAERPVPVI